jgi:integrase
MGGRRTARRQFGSIRPLPSGRYQARYTAPDGTVRKAPVTFDARIDAEAWLARQRAQIIQGTWLPVVDDRPSRQQLSFGAYAASWLATRQLATTTRDHYAQVLRDHIEPTFGGETIASITPATVRAWHASLKTGPTAKAHAYGLLRTIMAAAVADDVITSNPCRVRGAGQAKRAKRIEPASLAELETIAGAVPPRYRLMILLAAWCALRFGELAELRRSDIDVKNAIVRVRRGVVRGDDGRVVKGPKSEAGKRPVNIPPHLMPAVKDHLAGHVAASRDALVFPAASGAHMAPSALYAVYHPAREAAGRPDLRFHDLATGATLAAVSGATAELRGASASTPGAALLRYQRCSRPTRSRRRSKLAADVVPIPAAAGRSAQIRAK